MIGKHDSVKVSAEEVNTIGSYDLRNLIETQPDIKIHRISPETKATPIFRKPNHHPSLEQICSRIAENQHPTQSSEDGWRSVGEQNGKEQGSDLGMPMGETGRFCCAQNHP